MASNKYLHVTAFILLIIGGINEGLFAIIPTPPGGEGFDFIQRFFAFSPTLIEIIFLAMGVSAIYLAFVHVKQCKICDEK